MVAIVTRQIFRLARVRRSRSIKALLALALASGLGPQLCADQLANPTITAFANPYPNGGYPPSNLFDTNPSKEYACASQGPVSVPFTTDPGNGTWVEFDFGAPVTIDQFVMLARHNAADVIVESRLIVSADPIFDASDPIMTFNPSGVNWHALVQSFPPVTGRYARWEVTQGTKGGNLGAAEMWFMSPPTDLHRLPPPTAYNSYPAFSANYLAAFAVNGDAGSDDHTDYAGASAGAAMFVDFDFGTSVPIAGFDYWNRPFDVVTAFNLVFSDTPDFSLLLDTKSFTADPNGSRVASATFPAVTARYVRLQATAAAGANTGVREIQFYTVSGQKPLVSGDPKGGTRLMGDAFTFTVLADGDAPLSFQWWKDSTLLDGAVASSLVLTNLQEGDSGSYHVVITNPYGSVTSAAAALTVANPPLDIDSDLRLWLPLDDLTSLVAVDYSGNASDGTLQGFVNDDAQWVAGRIQSGVQFNPAGAGLNEVVLVPDTLGLCDFSANSEFTLAAWVKAAPVQEESAGLITKGTGGGGEQYGLDIYQGRYRFFGRAEGGSPVFTALGTVGPNGAWQHVVAVYSRTLSRTKLYVNGMEVASTAPVEANLLASSHEVSIGARQHSAADYDLNFNGVMDDVRIYGRALTPADVLALFDQAPAWAPSIAQSPQGFILPTGGAWTFTVGVDGSWPLSYQWEKDGAAIPDATNAVLTVTNASGADLGDYQVVVDNAHGTATSSTARLTVVPFLDLTAAPVQASSQFNASYPPANAFDGLRFSTGPSTARWASAPQGTPQWISVDLGQDMELRHVLVDWEFAAARDWKLRVRAGAEGPAANPDDWHEVAAVSGYVSVGNGIDGADVVLDFGQAQVTLQGNVAPSPTTSIQAGGVSARYVMLQALALTSPHAHFSIWELQVDAIPLPTLTIERSGAAVVIRWPAESSGFQLEETDRLPATTWTPVSGVVNNSVTVDLGPGEKFFRLRKQ